MGDAAIYVCQFAYPDHPHEFLMHEPESEWLVCAKHLRDMLVWRFNNGAYEVCVKRTQPARAGSDMT